MSGQGEIQQRITEAEYAATSATGDATITITNYYYREEEKVASAESADAEDAELPCPYRGLFHFGPNDAEFFFGRELFVEKLYNATKRRNFIPVLGASGSGKSSVVLAGLVPKLQKEGHWQFTHFRPGSDPFHALSLALVPLYTANLDETERIVQARKLANYLRDGEIPLADVFEQIQHNYPQDRILLIADQFEELYTLCADVEIRRTFLDKLISDLPAVLVMTMRADFLGNALSYRPFADVLQNADLKLGPMNHEELTEVIVLPATQLEVSFEAGLVERILEDVEDQPGNLPLLEFALTELWNKRAGKQLTHKVYEEIGEVEGALARHADEKYGNLTQEEKENVRRIFIQLVRPGEGAEDTRRIAMKGELGEESWSLVKQLADARLVVTSRNATQQETVEVVHEALIRNWGELRDWMNTDRVFRAWQERLRAAKRQWEATNKDPGSLLRGAALAEAEERLKERPEDLVAESEFIRQSIAERESVKREKAARRKREIRTAWGIAAGSLVAVAISSSLGWMAWNKTKEAELNQATSLAHYSSALLNEGKDLDAVVEAIRAGKILQKRQANDPEVMSALQRTIYEGSERNRLKGQNENGYLIGFNPDGKTLATVSKDGTIELLSMETGKAVRTFQGYGHFGENVMFSRDGKTLASGSKDGTIELLSMETGKEVRTLQGHDDWVSSVIFSLNGKTLASGSKDGTIKLWSTETGKEIRTFQGHDRSATSVEFSPDGKTLASISEDGTIKLWSMETGKEIRTFQGHDRSATSVEFSPDGKTLASISEDGTHIYWSVETGKEIPTLQGDDEFFYIMDSSADGKVLASSSENGTIKLWNVETGKEISIFQGHDEFFYSTSFSPDGKVLASSSENGTIKLWNVETGKEISTLQGHDEPVYSVSFSSDGKTLATGSDDKTIKLWNLETGEEINTFQGHDNWVNSVSFSPDGKILASGSTDETIRLWNVEMEKEVRTLQGHDEPVYSVSFSPDGKTLATGSDATTIKLWNVETGKEIRTLEGHDKWVRGVSFSPDGKTLATGSIDKTIKLWNVETGKEIRTLEGHDNWVMGVSFSPDGKTLATGSHDKTIKLWNVETGKEIRTLYGHSSWVNSVSFSPDGKTLATGSTDKTIKLWNVKTGKEIVTLYGHDDFVMSVSFSSDGRTVVSSSGDSTIKLWNLDLSLDSLVARSCDRVRNYLLHNPNVSEEDRQLCDGIGTQK